MVAAAAARVGARVERLQVTVPPGPNLEARARAARYAVLPSGVATGHTMDDQAETILVNLLRGAGADGLAGMAPGPHHPLLGLRRHETHTLCAAVGLEPVCDPSNDDPVHVRNRVRHELLPLCASVGGRDPVPLLARQAGVLRDEVALLESLSSAALPDPAAPARWPAPAARWPAAPSGVGCARRPGRRTHPRWPRSIGSWPSRPVTPSGPSSAAVGGYAGAGGASGSSRVPPAVVSRR